jgi:hydroxymethylbilane synthase
MKIRIGTRGSPLALWQAKHVAALITERHPGVDAEMEIIKTSGDKILDAPLAKIGGKGLFTKEIEDALIERRVDMAVHSMKDLPTELPEGLVLAAVLTREDPRDAFVSRDGRRLEELEAGARIGTSSLRRRAFLLNEFPGLEVLSIRGNLDTRLRKLEAEDLAGVVLACAGMKRMGFSERITTPMAVSRMIPAIGQGALGIEARVDDASIRGLAEALNDVTTATCVAVERAFLMRMGGGCQVPMAAHAVINGERLELKAAIVHPDGKEMIRDAAAGDPADVQMGVRLADILIGRGGEAIMKDVLGDDWQPGPRMRSETGK